MDIYAPSEMIGAAVGVILAGVVIGAIIAGVRTLVARGRADAATKKRRWASSIAIGYVVYALLVTFVSDLVERYGILPLVVAAVAAVISVVVWATSPRAPAGPAEGVPPPPSP